MATLKYKNGSSFSTIKTGGTDVEYPNPTVLSVGTGTGTCGVSVSVAGSSTLPNFRFGFTNLRGATGATGNQGPDGPVGCVSAHMTLYTATDRNIYYGDSINSSCRVMLASYYTSWLASEWTSSTFPFSYQSYSISSSTVYANGYIAVGGRVQMSGMSNMSTQNLELCVGSSTTAGGLTSSDAAYWYMVITGISTQSMTIAMPTTLSSDRWSPGEYYRSYYLNLYARVNNVNSGSINSGTYIQAQYYGV